MTIDNIKKAIIEAEKLPVDTSMLFTEQKDKEDKPTGWHSTWINTHRIRVVMHGDTLNAIVKDRSRTDLLLKEKEVVAMDGERQSYIRYIVVIPSNVSLAI